VVSFKLETDESLLIVKARDSLNKYKHKVSLLSSWATKPPSLWPGTPVIRILISSASSSVQLVIANVLQTRKHRVVFVTPTDSYELHLSREQTLQGLEIEEPIVADLVSDWVLSVIKPEGNINPFRA